MPFNVVRLVVRTRERFVLDSVSSVEESLSDDPYLALRAPRSLMAVPLVHRKTLFGVVYLESDTSADIFTSDHIHVVRVLAAQFAISLQNSRLLEETRLYHQASLRFVPQQALGLLGMRSVAQVSLGTSATFECSVMFVDVRDFTRLAERLAPRRCAALRWPAALTAHAHTRTERFIC